MTEATLSLCEALRGQSGAGAAVCAHPGVRDETMPDRGASTVVVVVCGTCARCMYSTRVCVYIRITDGSDMDTYRGAVTQSKFLLFPDRTQYQPPNDVVVDVVAEHSLAPW